jgi:2-hydroxychromene-2-carboxylate isomerase
MNKSVEFYFDFGSPASYLAWTQLPKLCAESGAALVYKPMLLGGVFQATGNQSPVMIPSKGRFMFKDLQRFARRYGVKLNFSPDFPINTLTLMRMAAGVQIRQPQRFEAFVAALFNGLWADGLNLGDPLVLAEVLSKAGFDSQAMLALASEPEVKDRLKATTAEAVARGVFGAPSLFVGDELFFGQDRLDFVREALLAEA